MKAEEEKRFARAIEAEIARLLGRPVLLSPREWSLVEDWRRRGVPLTLVVEALRHAARRRALRPGGTLTYAAPAVEEGWAAIRQGRVSVAAQEVPDARGLLAAAARRAAPDTPLGRLLTGALAGLDAGGTTAAIDAEIDRRLACAVPGEMRARAEEEVHALLARVRPDLREALGPDAFDRAVSDRLRAELHVPRIGLASDPGVS